MEVRIELVLNVDSSRAVDADFIRRAGRDATIGLLERQGVNSYEGGHVSSVRFNEFVWPSMRYMGPNESEEWCVTEDEREEWQENHDDDDEW